jgi:hypothetical protein
MTGKELRQWREGYSRTPRPAGTRGPLPPGMTQKEAAAKLGCSAKHYQRMETGKMPITERTARMVALLEGGKK